MILHWKCLVTYLNPDGVVRAVTRGVKSIDLQRQRSAGVAGRTGGDRPTRTDRAEGCAAECAPGRARQRRRAEDRVKGAAADSVEVAPFKFSAGPEAGLAEWGAAAADPPS